ncbi:uncharacterized protein LOC141914915 [Tubulanus polymorphus]|uniref:uncharacterized protein LOC141914915 n=1 Tax=Tubulanus polymorphus TaxID=672921 RepID=UPI003DA338AD
MATCINNVSLVIISILICFVLQVSSQSESGFIREEKKTFKCYQCNVFRGSMAPKKCDNPSVEDDCEVCLKYVTNLITNYGKPKYGGVHSKNELSVTSKVCIKKNSFDVEPGDYCSYMTGSKGYQHQCYCTGELCNHAGNLKASTVLVLAVSLAAAMNYIPR